MNKLTLSLVQLKEELDLYSNFEKHWKYIQATSSELIVFPECSLVGYSLDCLKKYSKSCEYSRLEDIHRKLFDDISQTEKTVVFGSILRCEETLYNCAFVANKEGIKIYRKINLTEEEKSVFSRGEELLSFSVKNRKIGVIICRDQSYMDIFYAYKKKEVDLIIILAAHYYEPSKVFWKRIKNMSIPIVRAMDFEVTVAKVNAVGTLDGRVSHGNTLVVSKEGKVLKMLDEYSENILVISL